jgi:formylglycine-generating enzyme required for sulfatase activity
MSGNVWEWVLDWYSENYYSGSPDSNPAGPGVGESKVLRGGSWFSEMKFLYLPWRDGDSNEPTHHDDITGFRCVMPPQ